MQKLDHQATWSSLPKPVLEQIGSLLEARDVLQARLMCKHWARNLTTSVATAEILAPPSLHVLQYRLSHMYYVCPLLKTITMKISSRIPQRLFNCIFDQLGWFSRLEALQLHFLIPRYPLLGEESKDLSAITQLTRLKQLTLAVRHTPSSATLGLLAVMPTLQVLRIIPSCTLERGQCDDVRLDKPHLVALARLPALQHLECWMVGDDPRDMRTRNPASTTALAAAFSSLTQLTTLHVHGYMPGAVAATLGKLPRLSMLSCSVSENASDFLSRLAASSSLVDVELQAMVSWPPGQWMSLAVSATHYSWLRGLSLMGLVASSEVISSFTCLGELTQLASLAMSLMPSRPHAAAAAYQGQAADLVAGLGHLAHLYPNAPHPMFPMGGLPPWMAPPALPDLRLFLQGHAAAAAAATARQPMPLANNDGGPPELRLDLGVLASLSMLKSLEVKVQQGELLQLLQAHSSMRYSMGNDGAAGGMLQSVWVPVDAALLQRLGTSLPSLTHLSLRGVTLSADALSPGLRHLPGLTSLELGCSISCPLNPHGVGQVLAGQTMPPSPRTAERMDRAMRYFPSGTGRAPGRRAAARAFGRLSADAAVPDAGRQATQGAAAAEATAGTTSAGAGSGGTAVAGPSHSAEAGLSTSGAASCGIAQGAGPSASAQPGLSTSAGAGPSTSAGAGAGTSAGAGPSTFAGAGPSTSAGTGPSTSAGAGPSMSAGAGPSTAAGAGPSTSAEPGPSSSSDAHAARCMGLPSAWDNYYRRRRAALVSEQDDLDDRPWGRARDRRGYLSRAGNWLHRRQPGAMADALEDAAIAREAAGSDRDVDSEGDEHAMMRDLIFPPELDVDWDMQQLLEELAPLGSADPVGPLGWLSRLDPGSTMWHDGAHSGDNATAAAAAAVGDAAGGSSGHGGAALGAGSGSAGSSGSGSPGSSGAGGSGGSERSADVGGATSNGGRAGGWPGSPAGPAAPVVCVALQWLPTGLRELSLGYISTTFELASESVPQLASVKLSRCSLGGGSLGALVAAAPNLKALRAVGVGLAAMDCPVAITELRSLTRLAVCSCGVRQAWRGLLPRLTDLPNLQVVEWCCTEGDAKELEPLAVCKVLHVVSSPHHALRMAADNTSTFRMALYCDLDHARQDGPRAAAP